MPSWCGNIEVTSIAVFMDIGQSKGEEGMYGFLMIRKTAICRYYEVKT
jgi:hypothetical protein